MKAAKKLLRALLRRFGGGAPPGVRRLDGPGHLAGGRFEGANSVGRGVTMQGDIRVGYASTISHNCELRGKVSIGRYVQLGPSILVVARDHPKTNLSNYVNNLLFEGELKALQVDDPVRIGNDAWIGGHATILKGVEIGHGAVVGGGSVVTRSIPPYAIAVGVPAKVVGHRFGETVIQALLKLEWWNYPPKSLDRIRNSFFVNLQELPEAEALDLLAHAADTLSTLPRIADGA